MSELARRREEQLRGAQDTRLTNRTLVVGNLARWNAEGKATVPFDEFQFTEFQTLTTAVLETLDPDIILSPLMGDDFDVLDVASHLAELGFKGRYRAITDDMPNVQMIREEVLTQAPGLDFDLLMMLPDRRDG